MDFSFAQTMQSVGPFLPKAAAALAILIVGWILAFIASRITAGVLRRTTLDDRLAAWVSGDAKPGDNIDVAGWAGKGAFFLVMLFVLVAVFDVLGLTILTLPLNGLLNEFFAFAPRILGAGLLLLVAWLVATAVRIVVARGLGATGIDRRLGQQAGIDDGASVPLTQTIATAVYWLVMLLFLPAILGALALEGILLPLQEMLNTFLAFLPNVFAAVVTLVIGWFLAKVIRQLVASLLAAAGVDGLADRAGVGRMFGRQRASGMVGLLAYVLVLIPTLIASLNALSLEALTAPASSMLNTFLAAIPALFGAALTLVVAFIIAKVVGSLISEMLAGLGFDSLLVRMGLAPAPVPAAAGQADRGADGTTRPSSLVGWLVVVGVMLFAAIEASAMLGFESLSVVMTGFLVMAGHILMGLVIFGVGLFLARLADDAIRSSQADSAGLLATAARVSILVLTTAIALRQMGLANEIINLAFGLLLGAVAVAVAIAFGVGGREVASRQLHQWFDTQTKRTPVSPHR